MNFLDVIGKNEQVYLISNVLSRQRFGKKQQAVEPQILRLLETVVFRLAGMNSCQAPRMDNVIRHPFVRLQGSNQRVVILRVPGSYRKRDGVDLSVARAGDAQDYDSLIRTLQAN